MSDDTPHTDADELFLYLTTTGWKSGQPHTIEIWFVEVGAPSAPVHVLCAEGRERAHWVRNIQHDPRVAFEVRTRADAPAPNRASALCWRPTATQR